MFNCEFDRLLTKSVPHILEKIFFSLDYDSLKACSMVCKAWNDIHSCDRYQRQAERKLREKEKNEQMLMKYSLKGDVEAVRNLLAMGMNPNRIMAWHAFEGTPLRMAAERGNIDVMNLLLNAGADPNFSKNRARSQLKSEGAFLIAVIYGQKNAAQLLIHAGAEIDKEGIHGRTPLYYAACMNMLNWDMTVMVAFLLNAGANPNKADKFGNTPLMAAACKGYTDVVKMLINGGAEPVAENHNGDTSLICASREGHKDTVQYLLDAGGDSQKGNRFQRTPLLLASFHGHQKVAQILLRAGADPDRGDKNGKTPLDYATKNGHNDIIKMLNDAKVRIENLKRLRPRPGGSDNSKKFRPK